MICIIELGGLIFVEVWGHGGLWCFFGVDMLNFVDECQVDWVDVGHGGVYMVGINLFCLDIKLKYAN